MEPRMREAAQTGNIDLLYALIREDPYVLERIDQVPYVDTPLHIAAFEGHINFAIEMMNLKPSFARKLNQDGFSPMHQALNNGQTKLVLRLLKTDKDLVRVKGREGMTPLHCAAIMGNLHHLIEFLEACPESIEDVTVEGQTALHLALKNDKIKVLNVLVGWLQRNHHRDAEYWEKEIVNWRDNEEETVLHIAAKRNQRQALKLLLHSSLPIDINAKNSEGLTASEIIPPLDGRQATAVDAKTKSHEYFKSTIPFYEWIKVRFIRMKKNMPTDMLNALLVIAALIITAAYQTSLSPPGGVWQGDNSSSTSNVTRLSQNTFLTLLLGNHSAQSHKPGTAVMNRDNFEWLRLYNSLTFWGTISLTAFLLPRVPCIPLLLMPLYLLGSCFQLSMSILSPTSTWSVINFFLAIGAVLFPCTIEYAIFLRRISPFPTIRKNRSYFHKVLGRCNNSRIPCLELV